MKYPYTIITGTNQRLIMMLPKEIELVTGFLLTELHRPLSRDRFMEGINRVLQDNASSWETQGNVYKLEIRKDFTRVVDMLADEETTCVIETEELKQIMETWIEITKEK